MAGGGGAVAVRKLGTRDQVGENGLARYVSTFSVLGDLVGVLLNVLLRIYGFGGI